MPTWNQSPDAIDPGETILAPLSPERRAALRSMSWIGYLQSPEWKSIRSFMLAAYPASQLSGERGHLEVHHVNWRPRGKERPRDLVVMTADEHRRAHGSLPPDELISLLLIAEEDPTWVHTLQQYRHAVTQRQPIGAG